MFESRDCVSTFALCDCVLVFAHVVCVPYVRCPIPESLFVPVCACVSVWARPYMCLCVVSLSI